MASGRTESELPWVGGAGVCSPSAGSRYRADVTIPAELRPAGGASGVRGAADDRPGVWIGVDTVTGAERSTDTARQRQQGSDAAAWDPEVYRRFGDERTRPFLDLLARVGAQDPSVVVDLGCGEGRATAVLAQRWPGARVIGVDSSPDMLAAAAATAPEGVEFVAGDVRDRAPDGPVDVVVSNAVLHWIAGHDRVITDWAGRLRPAAGWRCRCRAISGHPPTPCWPSSAGRPPGWTGCRRSPRDRTPSSSRPATSTS